MTLHRRRLATFLNDHLAVATAGVELARRARSSNRDTPYAPLLDRLADDLATDRALLRETMAALDVRADPFKPGAAWLGEKLGRLKPNDSLLSYSPLSRVVELEGLQAAVTLLHALWAALDELGADDDRVPSTIAASGRAERNLRDLSSAVPRAVREALVTGARSDPL